MNRVPFVGVSILSVQLGAAIAASLFGRLAAPGTVLLRQGLAAAVLIAIARPHLRGRSRRDWLAICAFGVVLAAMNVCFYESVAGSRSASPSPSSSSVHWVSPRRCHELPGNGAMCCSPASASSCSVASRKVSTGSVWPSL